MKSQIHNSNNISKFTRKNDVDQKWYLVDASDKVLGRMATQIAEILRGKKNPKFTPNSDTGDYVVVINAEKVKLTGKRENVKEYIHHSMYPGGFKSKSFKEMIAKQPDKVIRFAVKGMLPKNKLGNRLITKLKIYAGENHPHNVQKPELINI